MARPKLDSSIKKNKTLPHYLARRTGNARFYQTGKQRINQRIC